MTRWLAYLSYLSGSVVFTVFALSRGQTPVAVGSALFALGSLLLMLQLASSQRQDGVTRRQR